MQLSVTCTVLGHCALYSLAGWKNNSNEPPRTEQHPLILPSTPKQPWALEFRQSSEILPTHRFWLVLVPWWSSHWGAHFPPGRKQSPSAKVDQRSISGLLTVPTERTHIKFSCVWASIGPWSRGWMVLWSSHFQTLRLLLLSSHCSGFSYLSGTLTYQHSTGTWLSS